jgi:transglutaminase-like putative cysteine protease
VELVAQRFGDQSRLTFKVVSWETPDGQLVRFKTESHMSDTATVTEGRVHDRELQMEILPTTSGAVPTRQTIPWSAENGSFNAVERSLRDHPLKPGQRRTIRALEPLVNQVGSSELSARDFETTALPAGNRRLLRVDRLTRLAGTTIPSTFWIDEAGEVWKTRTEAMQQETFRTTREAALRPTAGAALDIGLTSVIRLKKPLSNAHQTQEVRYLVEMTDGDPSQVFPAGPSQSLRKLGPHAAELTVRAIRPGTSRVAGPASAGAEVPTEADRRPNSLIQSDDSRVQAMAREAAGAETDPWEVAKRLEAYVHRAVRNKNFSQALGSAAEVARSGEGDCTEHAVLLAALARARGIPARVALGLVYSDPAVFAFHMWTEVYVRGKWVPLDATLGRGGIGAAHLKIAQSSLDGADHLASFLPVAQALGRLKLEVLSSR